MDGLGIPLLGGLISVVLLMGCLDVPRFKRFALAALISPFATSVVFLIGLFIIADMNPAAEYGAHYTPTGNEHDPTAFDYLLWLGSAALTLLLSGLICVKVQRVWSVFMQHHRPAPPLPRGGNSIP